MCCVFSCCCLPLRNGERKKRERKGERKIAGREKDKRRKEEGIKGEITRKGGERKGRRYTNHDTRVQVIFMVSFFAACKKKKQSE